MVVVKMNNLTQQNKVSGVVQAVQVIESQHLINVREKSFKKFYDPVTFRNLHGHDFSGRANDYKLLPVSVRDKIDQEVVKDLLLYPCLWGKNNNCI